MTKELENWRLEEAIQALEKAMTLEVPRKNAIKDRAATQKREDLMEYAHRLIFNETMESKYASHPHVGEKN